MPDSDTRQRSAIISVLVENEAGVLARVIGLFTARGYNIDSLTVAPGRARPGFDPQQKPDHRGHLRHRDGDRADQGAARPSGAGLPGLRPVRRGPHLARELALIKVIGTGNARHEALRLADAFRARVIDASTESFIFELTGATDKLDAFSGPDAPLGPGRNIRTGVAAIARGTRTI